MDLKHFGDSYDIVKKSLIAWLLDLGPWSAHPMFTHHVSSAEAQKFARFLGVPLLSRERLRSESDRIRYFSICETAQHVFLDPDTGLKVSPVAASKAPHFLLCDELMRLAKARPGYLTLTFDQSLSRHAAPQPQIRAKLRHFAKNGLHSFAYVSHASFIIVGCRRTQVDRAYREVLTKSGLPIGSFVRGHAAQA
jgi:hypothetical protein